MTPELPRFTWWDVLIILVGGLLIGLLLSCGSPDPVRPEPVPAEKEAARLEEQVVAESTAAVQAEQAAAAAEREAAAPQIPADQLAAKKAQAERHRQDAERHRALAAELKRLRDDARDRIHEEQQEIDARAAANAVAAAKLADDRRLSWCVGIAIALATGAGALLTWLGVPRSLSLGVPGAVIAGALALSAWIAAGAWIALILGGALVLAVIAGLVAVLIVCLREWHHAADAVGAPDTIARMHLDLNSFDRQPPWIRWILDHLLPQHVPAPIKKPEDSHA